MEDLFVLPSFTVVRILAMLGIWAGMDPRGPSSREELPERGWSKTRGLLCLLEVISF